jgi:hypothetical protein
LDENVEDGQYFLCERFACWSQRHPARACGGLQECSADGAFELPDLKGEAGLSDAEVFGGVVEVGVPGTARSRRRRWDATA